MTGEKQGYYVDYQRSPISDIARSLSSGFIYQGEPSAFRGGKRGEAFATSTLADSIRSRAIRLRDPPPCSFR